MWRQGVKLRDDPLHFFAGGRVHLDLQFLRIIDEARVAHGRIERAAQHGHAINRHVWRQEQRAASAPLLGCRVVIGASSGIGPAEPSVESIVTHPQRHVADTGKEGLVQADAAILHPQWIEAVLLSVICHWRRPFQRSFQCDA